MAPGNFAVFNTAKKSFFDGTFDWDTDTFRTELLKQPYTFDATDQQWSDLSAQAVTTGTQSDYSEGVAMVGNTVVGGTAVTAAKVDSTGDVTYGPSVTLEAKWLLVRTGAATTPATSDKLLGVVDLDAASATATVSSTNGDFTITWHANGLFTVT